MGQTTRNTRRQGEGGRVVIMRDGSSSYIELGTDWEKKQAWDEWSKDGLKVAMQRKREHHGWVAQMIEWDDGWNAVGKRYGMYERTSRRGSGSRNLQVAHAVHDLVDVIDVLLRAVLVDLLLLDGVPVQGCSRCPWAGGVGRRPGRVAVRVVAHDGE
jgi:hypothetical protein